MKFHCTREHLSSTGIPTGKMEESVIEAASKNLIRNPHILTKKRTDNDVDLYDWRLVPSEEKPVTDDSNEEDTL